MKELLESSSLTQLASDVNKAILTAHGHQADLKIAFYWQMLQWSQEQLRRQVLPNGKRLDFPVMNDPTREELQYDEDEVNDDDDEDMEDEEDKESNNGDRDSV